MQGVFFRDSTRRVALGLGMTGHAVNLDDGSVEVLASGSESSHRELARWLREGPPAARVDAVQAEPAEPAGEQGFSTG